MSASVFPSKLLHQKIINDGKIIPIHIQLSPTNVCNLDCGYCSCKDRDKGKELSLEQIFWVLDVCDEAGTEAMTITGGGEPLMHPGINDIIDYAEKNEIEVGLVTNGLLLDKLKEHKNLTWCRISNGDDRIPDYEKIKYGLKINPQKDFAFSHVVTQRPNYDVMNELIDFANQYNFTHVRLVSDLLDLDNVPTMREIKEKIKVDDRKVIYQGRKDSTKGTKDCYISLLKPVIAPEGIFACCGVQYSIHSQPRDMVKKMRMGAIEDLPKILDDQRYFDGSICDVCYYSQYNSALSKLLNKPEHINFV